MLHLFFWFTILAFGSGFSSILVTLTSYFTYKKRILLIFAIYIMALELVAFGQLFELLYDNFLGYIPNSPMLMRIEGALTDTAVACIYFSVIFGIYTLFSIKVSKLKIRVFIVLSTLFIIELVAKSFVSDNIENLLEWYIESPIFYPIMIYCFYNAFINIKNINDSRLKNAIIYLITASLLLCLVELSAILLDYEFTYHFHISLYIITLNIFTIYYSSLYFNQPAYYCNNEPTQYFLDEFNITSREKDIISLVAQGLSNKEISDKLFISYKTVESHLRNCYSKTNVKSRIQLFNLLYRNIGD